MFCRNCKAEIADKAVVCVHCGVKPKEGRKYCYQCGAETQPLAEICLGCGAGLKQPVEGEKSWVAALLLSFFLGYLGIHRFYTGHTVIGIVQLLTLGGCYIWALVDFIMIITGAYKDANGNALKK